MATHTVTEFTDPFCTWCWGSEPILRRIQEVYGDQVRIEFVMGGLVEDFESFHDATNDISRPKQVAPHWEEASERHGMPVDASVWTGENPPQSTYPANTAYKAAEFQGTTIAHRYLRRLREAVASEDKNLQKRAVLVELADEIGLDVEQFEQDLESGRAKEAFKEDVRYARANGVRGFPTFHIERIDTGEERWLHGYRPFSTFEAVFEEIAPDLKTEEPRPLRTFVAQHGRVATKEVAEVYGLTRTEALERLRKLEDAGAAQAVEWGNGYFWDAEEQRSTSGSSP